MGGDGGRGGKEKRVKIYKEEGKRETRKMERVKEGKRVERGRGRGGRRNSDLTKKEKAGLASPYCAALCINYNTYLDL